MIRIAHSNLLAAAAIPLVALAVAGCGSSSNSSSAPAPGNAGHATVDVANTGLGNVLVDSQGHTLYLFGKDSGSKSACSGACATNWPPVTDAGKPTVAGGLKASKVATTARSGGQQVTYNGHPLYRFAGDQKPGDTSGQGINAFGGKWYVLSPSGTQVTSAPSSSTSSGGSGY
jgi:predicted lipoprotein with Yx(FWY)xxD motif